MPSSDSSIANKLIFAAFDFDNTITRSDSLLPFLFFCFGKYRASAGFVKLFPDFFKYAVKYKSRQDIKEDILTQFFRGMPLATLQNLADKFSSSALENYVKKEALERVRWHQNQGHHCILVSASIDLYLIHWAKKNGFDSILGSQLEADEEGLATGKLMGSNCWGKEKKKRLLEILPKKKYTLYAYGDSAGDRELLAMADYPFYRTFS